MVSEIVMCRVYFKLVSLFLCLSMGSSMACIGTDSPRRARVCVDTMCGENASCDVAINACVCDEGYEDIDGDCHFSATTCTDVAPENASSIIVEVTEPTECDWTCDSDYELIGDDCMNTQAADCRDEAPANATSTSEEVEINFVDGAWTEPAACAWTCDGGYGLIDGECLTTKNVPCADEAPGNATSVEENVTIAFVNGVWTEPAPCEWVCDEGYGLVNGECMNTRQVTCADEAPMNATSNADDVEISYIDGSWSEPATCTWSCNAGYGQVGDECLNSQIVPCADETPANASFNQIDVEITYIDGNWTEPAACIWACNTGYDQIGEQCLNSQIVPCEDVAPSNATSNQINVQISYEGGAWSDPATCSWTCNTGYGPIGEECLNSQMVECTDGAPANATSQVVDVEITYTGGTWSTPATCDWSCNEGFHDVNGTCVENVAVSGCELHRPEDIWATPNDTAAVYGRVYSTDGTQGAGRLEGITAMACQTYGTLSSPIDLTSMTCFEANYSGDANGLADDEYMATMSFATAGLARYFYAFSGDGGESWTYCDLDGEIEGTANPGLARVEKPCSEDFQINQTWTLDAAGPAGQYHGTIDHDGTGLWFTYTRPLAGSTQSGVFVTRIGCDGQVRVSPRNVITSASVSSPVPVMAYGDGAAYMAWAYQDSSSSQWRMSMRVVERDGIARLEEETDITPRIGGSVVSTLIWEPAIAALPGGGALIAVSAATANGFRVVLQKVDALGYRDGDAFYAFTTLEDTDQKNPSLTVGSNGTIYLSYSQGPSGGASLVYHSVFSPTSGTPTLTSRGLAHPTHSTNYLGSLSKSTGGPANVPWLVFDRGFSEIFLKDGAQPGPTTTSYSSFSVTSSTNHRAAVDASPSGGALVWFSASSGFTVNQVNVQRFTANANGSFQNHARVAVPGADNARQSGSPGPDIVHLFNHVYALTWSEGTSTEVRLKTRLVNLQ